MTEQFESLSPLPLKPIAHPSLAEQLRIVALLFAMWLLVSGVAAWSLL